MNESSGCHERPLSPGDQACLASLSFEASFNELIRDGVDPTMADIESRGYTEPVAPGCESLDSSGALTAELVSVEVAKAALDARNLTLVGELHRRAAGWMTNPGAHSEHRPDARTVAAAEIGAALTWTTCAALKRVDLAQSLLNDLPATFAALQAGQIDLLKARIISEATQNLDRWQARMVETRVLPRATTQTTGELGAALRRALIKVDPDGAEKRRVKAAADRSVRIRPLPDDMAEILAEMPAADAVEIYRRVDDLARRLGSADDRTMDQRRTDILIDLLLGRSMDKWLVNDTAFADSDEDNPSQPGDPYDDVDPAERETPDPFIAPAMAASRPTMLTLLTTTTTLTTTTKVGQLKQRSTPRRRSGPRRTSRTST